MPISLQLRTFLSNDFGTAKHGAGVTFFRKTEAHRSEHKLAARARRLCRYIYVPPAWMVIYFATWKLQLRKSNLVGCALHFTFGRFTREAGAARVDSSRVV